MINEAKKEVAATGEPPETPIHPWFIVIRQLDKLDQRVDRLEQRIDRLDQRIDALDNKFTNRIDNLESKMDGRFNDFDNKFTTRIDNLDNRLDSIVRWAIGLLVAMAVGCGGIIFTLLAT